MKIKVDFFKVEEPTRDTNLFHDALRRVVEMPDDVSRTRDVFSSKIRMQSLIEEDQFMSGELARIRMDEVPLKISLAGRKEEINLDEDEGIGEETAFMFSPELHVCAVQRNRYGVSVGMLHRYLALAGDIPQPINFVPVICTDGLQRIAGLGTIKRFRIKVAGAENTAPIRNQCQEVGPAVQMMDSFEANHVDIVLSMGRNPGTLVVRRVLNTATRLLTFGQNNPNQVEHIEVMGEDGDDRRVIDLLQYKMSESIDIDPGRTRRLTTVQRRIILREAWDRKLDEIRTIFTVA